eukprot:gene10014-11688_t
MKRFFICFLLLSATKSYAQQYALYNSRTLFDAFENPAQRAFTLDSSRKFASNFLLPNLGINGTNKGDANYTLRRLVADQVFNASGIPIGEGKRNELYQNTNIYLLTFRIFQSYKYHKELGFSWQVRTDARLNYTNESLALVDSYKRFTNSSYNDIFNNYGSGQSYHQFSVNYREDFNKKLSFGIKFSLLSGVTYNSLDIDRSSFAVYKDGTGNDILDVRLRGLYKANFLYFKDLNTSSYLPNFKNPGASISFGTSYKAKSGVFLMANVKDLGFIKWNNDSHYINFNSGSLIVNPGTMTSKEINRQITDMVTGKDKRDGFYSATNASADVTVSKGYGNYTPMVVVSKNLFYKGGDFAFVNSMKFNNIYASVTPAYNFNGFFMAGIQGMYRTPNFEVYMGTDNLLKTIAARQDQNSGSGYYGASFYMGMAIKFGGTVEHPLNSSHMPGVGEEEEKSFFQSIFGIFKKKKK